MKHNFDIEHHRSTIPQYWGCDCHLTLNRGTTKWSPGGCLCRSWIDSTRTKKLCIRFAFLVVVVAVVLNVVGVVIFVVVCTRQNMNHFDEDECVIVMFLFSDSILNRPFHGKKVDILYKKLTFFMDSLLSSTDNANRRAFLIFATTATTGGGVLFSSRFLFFT